MDALLLIYKCEKEVLKTMLPENKIEEGLSQAYVKAICAMAGYNTAKDENDYGIDLTIKDVEQRLSGRTTNSGFDIDVQIKATKNFREDDSSISYDLRNKNYNDLVDTKPATPRILVVLCLPEQKDEWLCQNLDSLILKRCAYWRYLSGQNGVEDNESKTAIRIPKSQCFTVDNLKKIMDCVKRKGDINDIQD